MAAQDTDKIFCRILFDLLQKWGVTDIVCSPGSRNTPLLIAAASRDELKKHFVVDERGAAFMGLGLSLVSKRPVALICTSGTALLNYGPAIAEAYYQGIPIVAISADRPIQWIDQDDSQTLRQDDALSNYVKKSYSIPAYGDNIAELQWYVERTVNDALSVATNGKPGPVHLNIHLADPLGNKIPVKEEIKIRKYGIFLKADSIVSKETLKELASTFVNSKVLVVAGFMQPDERLQKQIGHLSRFPNVTIMAETLSNLHLDESASSIDSTLTAFEEDYLDNFAPSLVISLGGALVSRKLKEYLRRNSSGFEHWALGHSHTTADCFMAGVERIETEPARFLKNLISFVSKIGISPLSSAYKNDWNKLRTQALSVKNTFIENIGWSELKAFDIILKKIPQHYNLFLSNGTAVRYSQIIEHRLPHAEYCNRGVSGIDGSTSTAIGGSLNYMRDSLLITGDLSIAYDLGALGIQEIPNRFKIIVIDNGGGGIFRFIPTTSTLDEREKYFCMPPLLPLRHLSEGYGWDYFEADGSENLEKELAKFLKNHHKSILRIKCDGIESAAILNAYMHTKFKFN